MNIPTPGEIRHVRERPVSSARYDEDWIASAWGKEGNSALLRKGPITPRPRVARAMELAAIRPGHRVLDIACGRGEVPAIACQRGAHAVGLDYAEASIQFAQRVKRVHGQSNGPGQLDLVQADACRLPFPEDTFDRVTMLDIVEHLLPAQLAAMFDEVRRVLKPDAFAVIHTLPNRWVYDVTYPLLHKLFRKFPRNPRSESERAIHVNEQDLPSLHRVLRAAGLSHQIWLEQYIAAQARWSTSGDQFDDTRDRIYPMLSGAAGRLLEVMSHTPLKLLLCNDIYGVLWKGSARPVDVRSRLVLVERLACLLSAKQEP